MPSARRVRARWRTPGRSSGRVVDVGDAPRLRAVGQVAVREQEHRRAVGDGDPDRLERGVEAVRRRARRDDRDRRLAVAAEHRLQQVGLLGLGRQAGRRAAALDVARPPAAARARPPARSSRPSARCPGPDVVVTPSAPPNDAPSAAPMPAISSSAWNVRTPNRLCLAQLVQDVRGRGDRVRAEEQRRARTAAAAATSPYASARLPEMLRYVPGGIVRRRHLVRDREVLGGLAEVPAGA